MTNQQQRKQQQQQQQLCKELWNRIELELLQGQKLQGTITTKEVYQLLSSPSSQGVLHEFPLIHMIYQISYEGKRIERIVEGIYEYNPHPNLQHRSTMSAANQWKLKLNVNRRTTTPPIHSSHL